MSPTGWVRAFNTIDQGTPYHSTGTGHGRGVIAVAHSGIWVANRGSRTVARLEPDTLELSAIQKFSKTPVAITACPEAIWAVGSNGWLWRLWPSGQQAEGVARFGRAATAIAVTEGVIWVLRRNGRLYGLDPASGEVATERKVPRGASHMIAHDGMLWISCGRDRRLVCFDPGIGRIGAGIQLPQRIRCLALTEDALLVGCARSLSRGRGWLHTIDGPEQRVVSAAELPGRPRAIVAKDGMAWVACGSGLMGREGTIERVDLHSGKAIEWRATEWKVSDLALIDEELLASMHLEFMVPASDGGGGGA